jgi:hypothetical protein
MLRRIVRKLVGTNAGPAWAASRDRERRKPSPEFGQRFGWGGTVLSSINNLVSNIKSPVWRSMSLGFADSAGCAIPNLAEGGEVGGNNISVGCTSIQAGAGSSTGYRRWRTPKHLSIGFFPCRKSAFWDQAELLKSSIASVCCGASWLPHDHRSRTHE